MPTPSPTRSPTASQPVEECSLVLDAALGYTFTWSIVGDELRGEMSITQGNCFTGMGFNANAGTMAGSDFLLGRRSGAEGQLSVASASRFNSMLCLKCQLENAINPNHIEDKVKSKLEINATLSSTAKSKNVITVL